MYEPTPLDLDWKPTATKQICPKNICFQKVRTNLWSAISHAEQIETVIDELINMGYDHDQDALLNREFTLKLLRGDLGVDAGLPLSFALCECNESFVEFTTFPHHHHKPQWRRSMEVIVSCDCSLSKLFGNAEEILTFFTNWFERYTQ